MPLSLQYLLPSKNLQRANVITFAGKKCAGESKEIRLWGQRAFRGKQRAIAVRAINESREAKGLPFARKK